MKTVKLGVPSVMTPPSATINAQVVPVFKGEGSTKYVCAGCDAVLVDGVDAGQINAMRIRCPKCGTESYFIDTL